MTLAIYMENNSVVKFGARGVVGSRSLDVMSSPIVSVGSCSNLCNGVLPMWRPKTCHAPAKHARTDRLQLFQREPMVGYPASCNSSAYPALARKSAPGLIVVPIKIHIIIYMKTQFVNLGSHRLASIQGLVSPLDPPRCTRTSAAPAG
eukprot:SAG31_NODE_5353_length_2592_cov_2.383129_3_plen_148_part_00